MGRLPVSAVIAVLLILSAAGRPGFAQSNIEANAGIQFEFSNPGARSRAMGGAFLGLSDDATAALANPAGLTQLAAPEFSFEGRASDFTTVLPFESDKRFDGTVINRDFTSGVNSPSFQSFVFAGNRPWSVALYRTELVNFESSGSSLGPYTQSGRRAGPIHERMVRFDHVHQHILQMGRKPIDLLQIQGALGGPGPKSLRWDLAVRRHPGP